MVSVTERAPLVAERTSVYVTPSEYFDMVISALFEVIVYSPVPILVRYISTLVLLALAQSVSLSP